ncbi:hypothetical protein JHK82_039644 [Glycine max]|nr:hypothetical protein JHK86_039834 [Glycine max]KAG4965437.1 hypothetical protein JHK85_040412 [Glycine max]KAG5110421.1 hypothetical protein JHK82_039644 [Glycine max]KAG5121706.1 hypothetical protein JHK84_040046 [Glycine max]
MLSKNGRLFSSPISRFQIHHLNQESTWIAMSNCAFFLFSSSTSASALHISSLGPSSSLVLITFDATWQHAREMVSTIEEFLSKFATRVCLGVNESANSGSIYDSKLILGKESFVGCKSKKKMKCDSNKGKDLNVGSEAIGKRKSDEVEKDWEEECFPK